MLNHAPSPRRSSSRARRRGTAPTSRSTPRREVPAQRRARRQPEHRDRAGVDRLGSRRARSKASSRDASAARPRTRRPPRRWRRPNPPDRAARALARVCRAYLKRSVRHPDDVGQRRGRGDRRRRGAVVFLDAETLRIAVLYRAPAAT
jgi:hypothetical protein